MSDALAERIALVTGGGRGIGRAISLSLAAAGASVAVNYRRDTEAAQETVAAIEAAGGTARAYAASVDNDAAVQEMLANISKDLGEIDLLVNNAGIASRGKSVERTDPDELLRVIRIHALAPHRISQLVLPAMKKKERGDIVMISSVATLGHTAGGAPYNMGKAAMESLAFTLAKEVRKHGIRVNIVAPGIVDTEMGDRLIQAVVGVDSIQEIAEQMPFNRLCQPEDVANVVRFLVSNDASYITGEKINVWGGGEQISGMV
jgi:3-oxoacyl-[acyl-carrier protein] reductase